MNQRMSRRWRRARLGWKLWWLRQRIDFLAWRIRLDDAREACVLQPVAVSRTKRANASVPLFNMF